MSKEREQSIRPPWVKLFKILQDMEREEAKRPVTKAKRPKQTQIKGKKK